MKTIVLDTNELARDWMLTGLKYQLFDHIHHATLFSVYVPAVVLEELVASHARAVAKVEAATQHLERDRRLVGLPPLAGSGIEWDYRKYVEERFDERPVLHGVALAADCPPGPRHARSQSDAALQREGDGIP